MGDVERKQSTWRRWCGDVSTGTVSGLLVILIVALTSALFKPVRIWLFADVSLLGWGLVIAVVAGGVCGFFIGRFTGQNRREAPIRGAKPARQAPVARAFQAGGLEEQVLQNLRFADGRWSQFAHLRDKLAVSSSQDLQQVISRLSHGAWIEEHYDNYIVNEGARGYRLGDKGITYAKQRGFETETESRRNQSSKA